MGDVKTAWDTMRSSFPLSLLDITLVAITVYYVLRLLRGTRQPPSQLKKGWLKPVASHGIVSNVQSVFGRAETESAIQQDRYVFDGGKFFQRNSGPDT